MKLPIKKLLVFFFARQGLSGPYQIRSSSSSDMDLIILVLWKKILIINMHLKCFFYTNVQVITHNLILSWHANFHCILGQEKMVSTYTLMAN